MVDFHDGGSCLYKRSTGVSVLLTCQCTWWLCDLRKPLPLVCRLFRNRLYLWCSHFLSVAELFFFSQVKILLNIPLHMCCTRTHTHTRTQRHTRTHIHTHTHTNIPPYPDPAVSFSHYTFPYINLYTTITKYLWNQPTKTC